MSSKERNTTKCQVLINKLNDMIEEMHKEFEKEQDDYLNGITNC